MTLAMMSTPVLILVTLLVGFAACCCGVGLFYVLWMLGTGEWPGRDR